MNDRAIYTILAIVVVLILAVWLLSPRGTSTSGTQTTTGPGTGVTRTTPPATTGPGSGQSGQSAPSTAPSTTPNK